MCELKPDTPKSRTADLSVVLPKIIEAGLVGNRQRLELLTLNAIRTLKSSFPEVANELSSLLNDYSMGGSLLRSVHLEPPPADTDAGFALLRIESTEEIEEPVLNPSVKAVAQRFLRERMEGQKLLSEGIVPPRTLLLKGEPGTGKTMLAMWLAKQLDLPLAVLDLATSISSFLGKTGANLRKSLDYARAVPCVLLLDEFDAIGKRRDDTTEHGELKRIVNVLLKELEVWPMHSVLVAATNHPELLDPAINRRFDVVLEMPLPAEDQRQIILERACGRFTAELPEGFLKVVAHVRAGTSGSDLDTLAKSVVRRHIIERNPLTHSFIEAIEQSPDGIPKGKLQNFIRAIRSMMGLTVREIAELTGRSSSTIQYHLNKPGKDSTNA